MLETREVEDVDSEQEAHLDFSERGADIVGRIYTVSPKEGEQYYL